MNKLYFMRMASTPINGVTYRFPKLIYSPKANPSGIIHCKKKFIDNGHGDTCIVKCEVTQEQHSIIFHNVDALSVDPLNGERNLNENITLNEINKLKTFMDTDQSFIPLDWIDVNTKRKTVLKGIACIFIVGQCITGLFNGLNTVQVLQTLNTTLGNLPAATRNKLLLVPSLLKIDDDTLSIKADWTTRRYIKEISLRLFQMRIPLLD